MINQVTLEGFVVSRWKYKGDDFLRIAHHRPRRKDELVHSDYVTVRVDRQVELHPDLQQGDLVQVSGEVWSRDILEPLGKLFQKARLNIPLPPELEKLIVPRPTTYIFAQQVTLIDSKEEAYESAAKVAGRPFIVKRPRKKRDEKEVNTSLSPNGDSESGLLSNAVK